MKIRIDPNDTLFSKLIRFKRPICEGCGIRSSTQVHHFKGRRYQSVRFSEDNIWALCFTCHRKFHEDADYAVQKMKKRLGDKYDQFVLMANAIVKRYDHDKKLLNIYLKQEMKKYESER